MLSVYGVLFYIFIINNDIYGYIILIMSIISNITAAIFFKDIVSDVDQSLNIDYKNNNCYILWDPTCPSDVFSIEAPDEVLQKLYSRK